MVHGQAFAYYNMTVPTSPRGLSLSTSSLQTRYPLWYTVRLSRIITWQSPPHREASPYPPALSKHVTHYGYTVGQTFTYYNMTIPTSSRGLSLLTSSLQTRFPLWYTVRLSRIITWQSSPHREASPYPPLSPNTFPIVVHGQTFMYYNMTIPTSPRGLSLSTGLSKHVTHYGTRSDFHVN